jgi:hypothetical protein
MTAFCLWGAEPFGKGIVNAQLSVLKGLEAAKRHGYIFVVPPMVQWWAEHEPSYLLIIPFNHFYDADHFEKFAREYGEPCIYFVLHVTRAQSPK